MEILGDDVHETVRLRRIRFISHSFQGSEINIYALWGEPLSPPPEAKLPALLHIHGGTQTADLDHVLYFARCGYSALSFDWSGPTRTRTEKFSSRFPEMIAPMDVHDGPPEYARILHVVWAARRALTLLASQPRIDSSRMGAVGISWGGLAVWLLNGIDKRLAAAVPVYGCGLYSSYTTYPGWMECFHPDRWAHSQHAPLFHLNGTNDFFGSLEALETYWNDLPVEKRLGLSANEDHGLEESTKSFVRKWLDAKLIKPCPLPPVPELSLEIQDGGLWVEVFAPEAIQVRIYYAVSGDGTRPGAYWYLGPWGRAPSGFFSAKWHLPLGSRRVCVFAEAQYQDGSTQSSFPYDCFEKIGTIALAAFDASIWYDPRMGKTPWFTRWHLRGSGLTPGQGNMTLQKSLADSRLCITQHYLNQASRFEATLRRPACPVVGRGEGSTLSLQLYCPEGAHLVLAVSSAVSPKTFEQGKSQQLERKIPSSPRWLQLLIPESDWEPFDFKETRLLHLCASSPGRQSIEIGRIQTTA